MTKEKLVSLTKYLSDLVNKSQSTVIPEKHKNHSVQYKEFLEREIKEVKAKLDRHKLEGAGK